MNKDVIAIKNALKFELVVYKAVFENVDFSEENEERYFSTEEKARAWLIEAAGVYDIQAKDIPWKKTNSTYFNYQFKNHPTQGNSCYHGSYEKIEIE